ncbi:MAG: Pr6Pr family membrane protein [Candidatus Nanopelagicales bacterium]
MSDTATTPATLTVAPRGGMIVAARWYWGLIALIGTLSLVVSLWVSATAPDNGGALNGMIFTLSYFTVWSNIFALIINWALAADPTRDGKGFRWLRMTALVMIVITGLIYAILLAPYANPKGINIYTNLGFHYIVPWATLLGFLIFGPRPRFTWDLVPKMMIIPVLWLVYTLIHGAILTQPPARALPLVDGEVAAAQGAPQNWYPYPFIDVNDPSAIIPGLKGEGYGGVAINLVVVIILGIVFASAFLGLDRLLSRGQKPTPLTGDSPMEAQDAPVSG